MAGLFQGLIAAAAIIDSQLFEDESGRGIFERQLAYGLFGEYAHGLRLAGGAVRGYDFSHDRMSEDANRMGRPCARKRWNVHHLKLQLVSRSGWIQHRARSAPAADC